MKTQKTAFYFEGEAIEDGLNICDTIEHEGRLWLVPKWIHNQETGTSTPERIICLSLLAHQKSGSPDYDYVLNRPIPKAAFDGTIQPPQEQLFSIVENPPGIEVDTRETSSD